MALTTSLEKSLENARKDLEKTLTDPTPLYAVVGVTDLAVAKLRAVRDRLDPKVLRDQTQTTVESVQADMMDAPVQAQAALEDAVASARSAYTELAGRGKSLVQRVRRQQATADLRSQAKSTVSHAKATSTSAKKAAANTKRSAKSTATSARKTTSTAKKATSSTAKKVGK